MQVLIKLMDHLERMMVAATFSEAGCWDTALRILDEDKSRLRQRPQPRASVSAVNRPTLRM